jgi:hypothetical protein
MTVIRRVLSGLPDGLADAVAVVGVGLEREATWGGARSR